MWISLLSWRRNARKDVPRLDRKQVADHQNAARLLGTAQSSMLRRKVSGRNSSPTTTVNAAITIGYHSP